ncbi:MAG: PQQ-binding-like beta-propeller repeat protein [Saprospiraceae bacterium]|nr:PQQ-binding-like beta-propeller repeat protein [Saprospiraceae bacterium]
MQNVTIYAVAWVSACLVLGCSVRESSDTAWSIYHGDHHASHYSPLTQIKPDNVSMLKPAWIWHSGDATSSTTIQCNPVIANSRMFVISPGLDLVCLHPATGKEIWRFTPGTERARGGTSRGVVYWTDGRDERIYYSFGSTLFSLRADDGTVVTTFADNGKLSLYSGLDSMHHSLWIGATTPGVIFEDLLIIGSRVGEGPGPTIPGHIRAFNIHTGDLEWLFRTIPTRADPEASTWSVEHLDEMGGANSWGGFSLDLERGLVFAGTGSASYDHWGGNRIGTNLYANCVLALDARTGKKHWHQQLVHHDIWDYDIPCQPNLVQVKRNGALIDAVAQPTKMGHLFVFERETGDPIYPVEERDVPKSVVPGEESWPTQPFPPSNLRYAQQGFLPEDLANLSSESHEHLSKITKDFQWGDLFEPPGLTPTMTMPQFNGGTDWGGAGYHPPSRTLFVNCSNVAEWIKMVPNQEANKTTLQSLGNALFRSHCATCHSGIQRTAPSIAFMRSENVLDKTAFTQLMHNGKALMPSFSYLSDAEVSALYHFVSGDKDDQRISLDTMSMPSLQRIPWLATGHHELSDSAGFPANTRPWGTLNAINLDAGRIIWQQPLGTYPSLEAAGLPPTGTFNMGGPLVTGSGLVFIGSTMDERFRAFDQATGDVLWEYQLSHGAYCSPSTFSIAGRQYVIIGAGGGGKPGTPSGDAYYCFSLE